MAKVVKADKVAEVFDEAAEVDDQPIQIDSS
jgi:hypothetical protein